MQTNIYQNINNLSVYLSFSVDYMPKCLRAYYKFIKHTSMCCKSHLFCINSWKLFYFLSISDNTNYIIHMMYILKCNSEFNLSMKNTFSDWGIWSSLNQESFQHLRKWGINWLLCTKATPLFTFGSVFCVQHICRCQLYWQNRSILLLYTFISIF